MKQVYQSFTDLSRKTTFMEESEMNKEEKSEFLERFKKYKDSGAVLLGVVSGSFGEGIDLPGKLLNCVVVVGLPLQQPTLETKKLIEYYDMKFAKGWEYGYVGPAFSKCLQSAGRCIRSETDRGVIVFLDERYAWQNYYRHFPADLGIEITKEHLEKIKEFFRRK
jgi:DNA excision repair protein ERCC-2